ncbi:MAG TPA: hypothetical protein VF941_07235 [Clostridia bacterium]
MAKKVILMITTLLLVMTMLVQAVYSADANRDGYVDGFGEWNTTDTINMSYSQKYDDETKIDGGYIFEDGPEGISDSFFKNTKPGFIPDGISINTKCSGRCFIEVPLDKGKVYEAAIYNWNHAQFDVRIGLGIHNLDNAKGSITIYKKATNTKSVIPKWTMEDAIESVSKRKNLYVRATHVETMLAFLKASNNTTKTTSVPAIGELNNQGSLDIMSDEIGTGECFDGRIRFKVNSSNMYAKVYCIKASEYKPKYIGYTMFLGDYKESMNTQDPFDGNKRRYIQENNMTGLYKYVARDTTIDGNDYFTLCGGTRNSTSAAAFYASNEYKPSDENKSKIVPDTGYKYVYSTIDNQCEKPVIDPYHGICPSTGILGNYGIVYTLTSKSEANFFVIRNGIRPKDTKNTKEPKPRTDVVYYNGAWRTVTTQPYEEKFVPIDNSQIKFVLASGNGGFVDIKFLNMKIPLK